MYNITFPSTILIKLFYLCSIYSTLTEHSLHPPTISNLKLYFVDHLEFEFLQDFCLQILCSVRCQNSPVHTGPGAHPASHTMGAGSFPGIERPRLGIDHPPLSSVEVKERVGLYLYSPYGPSWTVIGWNLALHLGVRIIQGLFCKKENKEIVVCFRTFMR
jgi:hypothetical protein